MLLWYAQMVLNFIWSPVVFTLHSLALGLATILALLAVIVGFIWVQASDNRLAVILLIPYAACAGKAIADAFGPPLPQVAGSSSGTNGNR